LKKILEKRTSVSYPKKDIENRVLGRMFGPRQEKGRGGL
jgi:hypothetical protein